MSDKGFEPAPADPDSDRKPELDSAIRMVANNLHRLNESIMKAVDAGATIELMRSSRYHSGAGNWGDQMIPIIRQKD